MYVIKGMPGFVSCNAYICRIKSSLQHYQVAQGFKVECIHAGFKNTSVKSMQWGDPQLMCVFLQEEGQQYCCKIESLDLGLKSYFRDKICL